MIMVLQKSMKQYSAYWMKLIAFAGKMESSIHCMVVRY